MSFLTKIFGDANDKYIKELQPVIEMINRLEPKFEGFSNEDLRLKTDELKESLKKGKTLDDILPEAFALVREASKRTLNQRHFNVQLIGGIVLHQGKIAEMKTGEGKTLTATLAVYLNALTGEGCHLVTVNDYLARRDAVWMGQIYNFLGLTIGCINHDQSFLYDPAFKKQDEKMDKIRDELGAFKVVEDFLRPCSRKEAYSADITYGTNNEYGFDYLRNNMAYDLKDQVQRGYNFAIVDEVDSILIDEARTPLIISSPDTESSKMYSEFAGIIRRLDPSLDYEIDEKMRAVTITEHGIEKVEEILGMKDIYQEKGIRYLHHLEQALRAQAINSKTGQPLFARDKDYIVKDGQVIIVDEFTGRVMPGRRWSGGLHQAIEAKEGVTLQPESLTLGSITFQNYFRMYKKLAGMTGTAATSAEEFEKVYKLDTAIVPTHLPMVRNDLPDRIYKTGEGKFRAVVREIKEMHAKGQPVLVGTVSIEKNEYLGKLLDIEGIPHKILNAKHHEQEGEIIAQAGRFGAVTIATNMAGRGVDIVLGGNPLSPEEAQKVTEQGGLHVIGTERHEARRIDNQLRGRSGRQGDPGSTQFFISLEDDLMRIFGGDRIKSIMEMLKVPEDEPIEAKMVSGVIESAQEKIEGANFDLRKHVLDYDDVLNKHRDVIYRKRGEILKKEQDGTLKEDILEMFRNSGVSEEDYVKKEKEIGSENMRSLEKFSSLKILDFLWMEHLDNMEHLRDTVRLRAYGQKDPLIEYKGESRLMFQNLLKNMESGIVQSIIKAEMREQKNPIQNFVSQTSNNSSINKSVSVAGRNDPCPCGSGKKFKKCHGR
ncbi:MAG: preprotein translocase subunit SecA [Candidatus Parcubacteria bacterium]|nr:preprotein translocase subunit SecA [Candidatus Parcubacteria bacterium]